MKHFLAISLCCLACGCNGSGEQTPQPLSPPAKLRYDNWTNVQKEGSCGYSAIATLLNLQHQYQAAAYIRSHYSGPANIYDAEHALNVCGVPYAETTSGDESFLEASCDTRRGCMMIVGLFDDTGHQVIDSRGHPALHAVDLIYLDGRSAGILDCNDPNHIYYVDRACLMSNWHHVHGIAMTPIGTPPPPLPDK